MRDRFGGGDEVAKAHPLVGRRPFLVDADIARTILHGRDTEHFLDDIAVTDIAEPPIRADHSRLARGQSLALRQRGDERVVRRTDHRPLIPGLLGAARGDFEHAIECGVILLDARQQPLEEPGGLMYRFLQCTAVQYMTRDVATVTRDVTLRELEALFEKHDFNSFPVAEEGKMLGIVTKFDFLRAFAFTTGQMVPHYDELMKRPGGASDYRGRRASFLKVARYLMELPVLPFAEPASHPRER